MPQLQISLGNRSYNHEDQVFAGYIRRKRLQSRKHLIDAMFGHYLQTLSLVVSIPLSFVSYVWCFSSFEVCDNLAIESQGE